MDSNCKKKVIKSREKFQIFNTLRQLGLKPRMNGTKFINKCILYIITSNNEFYNLEDIFKTIIVDYPNLNSRQIRTEIKYALEHRNEKLTEANFENIFGFKVDEDIFRPKEFIDEFVYMMLEKSST